MSGCYRGITESDLTGDNRNRNRVPHWVPEDRDRSGHTGGAGVRRSARKRRLLALREKIKARPSLPVHHTEERLIHGQLVTVKILPTLHADGAWSDHLLMPYAHNTPAKPSEDSYRDRNTKRGKRSGRRIVRPNTTKTKDELFIEEMNRYHSEKQRESRAESAPSPEEAQRKAFIRRRKAEPGHVGTWGAT